MAKIPKFNSNAQYSTAVERPMQTAQAASAPHRERAQAVSGAVNFLAEVQQKRQQAETNDYVRNSTLEFSQSAHDYETKTRQETQGDHRGYTDGVKKHLEENEKRLIETAPNREAAKEMEYRFKMLKMDQLQSSNEYEYKKRAENFERNQAQIVQNTSLRFYQDPNPTMALKEMPMTLSDLDREIGVTATEETVRKMQNDYIEGTRDSIVTGLIDKGLYDQADEVLTSDRYSQLRTGMNVNDMSKYKSIIQNNRERVKREQISLTTKDAENAIAALLSGRGTDPRYKESIRQVDYRIESLPDGEEKASLRDQFAKSVVVANTMDSLKGMSTEQIATIEPSRVIAGDLNTLKDDVKFQGQLAEAITKNLEWRNKDSANYIESTDPSLAGSHNVAKRVDRAKELGIANVRGISKAESAKQIQYLNSSPTAVDKAKRLDEVMGMYGGGSKQALSDMVKDGLDGTYLLAAHYEDNLAKSKILDNFGNKKAIDTRFKDLNSSDAANNISAKSEEAIRDMAVAVRSSFGSLESSAPLINSLKKTVELEAKRLVVDEDLSTSEAVETAYKNTIAKQWSTATYEAPGKDPHTAMIPKSVDKRNVEAFMKHYSTANGLAELGVTAKRRPEFGGSDEEFQEMVSENSYFVTNETQDGVYLRFVDASGLEEFVKDSNGSRINVKYSEMGTQKYHKVLDERNALLGASKLKKKVQPGAFGSTSGSN